MEIDLVHLVSGKELCNIFMETHDYLSLKTLFVVISNPFILFDGIWNLLILDQVDTGPLKKSANLKRGLNFKYFKPFIDKVTNKTSTEISVSPHNRSRSRPLR